MQPYFSQLYLMRGLVHNQIYAALCYYHFTLYTVDARKNQLYFKRSVRNLLLKTVYLTINKTEKKVEKGERKGEKAKVKGGREKRKRIINLVG